MQDSIVRTYRGGTRETAEQAYVADAAAARAAGFTPVAHRWTEDHTGHVLSVAFRRTAAELPAAPPVAEARTDVAAPAPPAAPAVTAVTAAPVADEPRTDVEPPAPSAEVEGAAAATAVPVPAAPPPAAAPVAEPAHEPAYEPAEPTPAHEPAYAPAEPTPAVPAQTPVPAEAPAPAPPFRPEPTRAPAPAVGRSARLTLQAIDLHCAGEPLRLIRSGFPDVPSAPILERRRWVRDHADEVRRVTVYEPRGHRDMYGAVLLPPYDPAADVAVLFMHNDGYSTMCGHGIIAITTALIEEGLFPAAEPETVIRYETPAGIVVARAATSRTGSGHAVRSVSFTNVPSYLAAADVRVHPSGLDLHGRAAQDGALTVDIAFGGAYYGIVDAADLGLRVVPERIAELAWAGTTITEALRREHTPQHPTDAELGFVYGTIIVDRDPPSSPDGRAREADIRNVTIFADAEVDRSPCGSGTSALLAHLYARGGIRAGSELVNAGIIGESFVGRVERETWLGPHQAVVTSVEGNAFVTGYLTLVVDARDPLGEGFLLR